MHPWHDGDGGAVLGASRLGELSSQPPWPLLLLFLPRCLISSHSAMD